MKKALLLVLISLFFAGLVEARDYIVEKKAGDLTVMIRIDRNPPVVGSNNLDITLKDATGREVTDANIVVDYGMSGMPGMPAMNYRTGTQLQNGKYGATVKLSMAGPWTVTLKISRQGKTATTRFTVDAR